MIVGDLCLLATRTYIGVTLVELIIGLTIGVILTLVSIPLFIDLVQAHRVSAAAENLYNVLQYARSDAVKRNTNVYVSLTTGSSWCYGINLNSTCNCAVANNCGLGTVSAPSATQTTLSTAGLVYSYVYFEGSHGAANVSGSATFTVYGKSSSVTINIGRLGGLQMCSTGVGGYPAC